MSKRKLSSNEEELIDEVKLLLGDGLIDIDLDTKHFIAAMDYAFKIYRQRVENATSTVGIAFKAQKGIQEYDLSKTDIASINSVMRNNIAMPAQNNHEIDPFMMLLSNSMMGGMSPHNNYGSIATVHMQYQQIELVKRILANEIEYSFNKATKKLTIFNAIRKDENLLLIAENYRSNQELLSDSDISPWITSYTLAKAKYILGQAYSLFGQLPGPNGGITIDGAAWKQEAKEEMTELEEQLIRLTTSTRGMPFITG